MGNSSCGEGIFRRAPAKQIAPGGKVPAIVVDYGFSPTVEVNMAERTKGKKVIILGLPGAFTPC